MASIVSVVVSDDLDGSEGAETVTFAFDGVTYEIDLAERNRAKLAKAMAPYIDAARRVRPRRARASSGGTARSRASGDSGAVRKWAKQQGLKVSERGRISAEVMAQYEAAN
jgi:hypothetical protein